MNKLIINWWFCSQFNDWFTLSFSRLWSTFRISILSTQIALIKSLTGARNLGPSSQISRLLEPNENKS